MGGRLRALLSIAGMAAVAIAAASACESFSSTENGPGDASTNDAPTADAPTSTDGGGGDAPPDAASAEWALVFEEKFEQGIGAWTVEKGGASAHALLDGGLVVATDTPDSGFVYIRRQPPGPIAYSELRLEARLGPTRFGSPLACLMFVQPGPAQRPNIRLQVQSTGASVLRHERTTPNTADDHTFTTQLQLAQLTTVRIELGVEALQHVKVAFNDVVVLDVPLKEAFPKLERPEIGIGLACEQSDGHVFFDDVALYKR